MAKGKKRIATPKKATKRRKASTKSARTRVSKRRKASAKAGRKKAVRHATPKRRPWKTTAKTASRKAPRRKVPVVEDTIIDVIDEPVPGVVRVTECETISMTTPKPGADPETE
jgi:hypothetical protein